LAGTKFTQSKYFFPELEEYFVLFHMLIDTHAHVNFKAFSEDADATMKRALNEGVWVINVGTQIDTSKSAVKMAEKYDQGVYAVIGLHPVHTYSQHVDEEETSFQTREEHFNTLEYQSLAKDPKVVGIGECGLDYYRLPQDMNHESGIMNQGKIKGLQKHAFVHQIKLAKELNKALVIHCRPSVNSQDAYEDILRILDSEGVNDLRFEIHSFTGSPETVQQFLKRGSYVGLNGIITFDKTGNMQKVVETLPLERIVLETDSPYLTPIPHRGKRNEPAYVKHVAEKIAEIKKVSINNLADQTTKNAKQLFAI
jgi:TatD DNase family protein